MPAQSRPAEPPAIRPAPPASAHDDLGVAVPERPMPAQSRPAEPPAIRPAPPASAHDDLGVAVPERPTPPQNRPAEPPRPRPAPPPMASTRDDLGMAVPERAAPPPVRAAEPAEPRPAPTETAARNDLGATAPERAAPPRNRAAEGVEARPTAPHAPARERSTSVVAAGRIAPNAPRPRDMDAPPAESAAAPVGQAERQEPQLSASPAPGAAPPPLRSDAPVPPAARLDGMRVRPAPAPGAATPKTARKGAARDKDGERPQRRRRPQSAGAVFAGKLAENIPRKMRAHRQVGVEVRISREESGAFLSGLEGGETVRHNIVVSQTMSVMLRAPDGGFIIENLGPETQWIFHKPGTADNETFGRWMWSVTPTETGRRRLQLVVAARSVDEQGLAGDTALPEQVITVQVGTNYARSLGHAIKWVFLMALGGAVTEGTLQILRLFGK
jgi:hypothetical protein